jgi:predicted choloylglycine hydrolase
MAYNVSLIDATGRRAVVSVAPDRPTSVREADVATTHPEPQGFTRYARATKSAERERFLYERLADPALDAEAFTRLFLEPPLFNDAYARAHGTLYTAVYRPSELSASFLWQAGLRRDQSFAAFEPSELDVSYVQRA